MQLDGPDLEELLVRARHQYGSEVRIVQADKVRTGGIGGFFAREHYQLSVEMDGTTSDQGAAEEPSSPSLLDLADAVSDSELSYRASATTADDGFTPGFPPANPVNLSGPALSTDGETFAEILARLSETAGSPIPTPAPANPDSPPDPLLARPIFAEPAERRCGTTAALRRPKKDFLPALSVQDLRGLGLPPALVAASDGGDLLATLVRALRELPVAPPPPSRAGDVVAVVGDGETAWDAGLDVARSVGLDERAMVYLTAGKAPTRIAPARRVTGIDQLAARLDRWRKRATPTIAVLDAPMSVKSAWWNRRALATLRAQAVWLVVPATRKTDDVAGWVHRLGRADAVIVTDADSSADPASVLRLGLPVAWLDGRPATPGAWAGLLVDRLVARR